jgi:predicted alpha/beta hydrolase family esterase
LLVAPADVDLLRMSKPETSPIPILKLDFPTVVITSSNDPIFQLKEPSLAEKWGSTFINIMRKAIEFRVKKIVFEGQEILQSLLELIENEI